MYIYRLLNLIVLLFLLTACQRGGSSDITEIGLKMSLSPEPPTVGPTIATFTLTDASGQPINGATLELEGNMSHAGMVPLFSQASEMGNGHYEAPIEFTMGGDWFILVKTTLPTGQTFERQLDVPGVVTR